MVVTWNNAVIAAQRADTTSPGPGWSSRNFAIVHLAIFDAVNAITRTHSSFALDAVAPAFASQEAAVAQAARDTLAALYPAQTATFDALLAVSLGSVPDGPSEDAGVAIGHLAAAALLSLRSDDGAAGPMDFEVNPDPGHWSPDPLHPSQQALGPGWGDVTPLGMLDPDDFQVPPPPAMDSAQYAAAFEEVKSLGELNSAARTADQTEIGIFWAYDRGGFGPPTVLYNQNVQEIAMLHGNTLAENARLFALVNLAMADAGITIWNTKYTYDFWRPVTAIRRGAEDGNPATLGDPDWIPLGAPDAVPGASPGDFTPPFPAYTSGHAGFGAATFKTLANFYGLDYGDTTDSYDFQLTSEELPGVVRSFESFEHAAQENGKSRIYLGIHWEFDNQLGQQQGREIADDIFSNLLVPRTSQSLISLEREGSGLRTIAIPAGADLEIRRQGQSLQVWDREADELLLSEPLAQLPVLRLDLRNGAADQVRLDLQRGGEITSQVEITILSDQGEQDVFRVIGTSSRESFSLDGDSLAMGGSSIGIQLVGLENVVLAAGRGHDTFTVNGDQSGRHIELRGERGNDRYEIGAVGAFIQIVDPASHDDGRDLIDFSQSSASVDLDLSQSNGEEQTGAGGNVVSVLGPIENLIGSPHADTLRGNRLANSIQGLAGNDSIFGGGGNDDLRGGEGDDWLAGEAGHDCLYGDEGNDLMLGGAGDDKLIGRSGFDMAIGGIGRDKLDGSEGDYLLIGGTTSHDQNQAALLAIRAEWSSGRTRAVRIANLTDGTGSPDAANGSFFLTTGSNGTVRNDSDKDTFYVGPLSNWVFRFAKDQLKNKS